MARMSVTTSPPLRSSIGSVMSLGDAEQALGILVGQAVKDASLVEVSIQTLCDQAKVRNVHHFPCKQVREVDHVRAETRGRQVGRVVNGFAPLRASVFPG